MSRSPRPSGRDAGWIGTRLTAGTLVLLVVEVAAFLVFHALGEPAWVDQHVALVPTLALGREPWQLLSSAFVHVGAMSLLLGGLVVWIFGSTVEQAGGAFRLFLVLLSSQVLGAVAASVVGRIEQTPAVFVGMAFMSMGVIAAFGAMLRSTPISVFGAVTVRAGALAGALVAFGLMMTLFQGDVILLAGEALGAVGGWLAVGSSSSAGRVGRSVEELRGRVRWWRVRRRYRVIPGGRDQRRSSR